MRASRKRFFALMALLPVLVFVTALVYRVGMANLEGKPRGFWAAMEWAAETITTTGYGGDATWNHPLMSAFVISVQFLGVFMIYMIIPMYLIPFLEEHFESRLPRKFRKLDQHVVIFRYGPAVETLVRELQRAAVPFGIIETDAQVCRQLVERKLDLIHVTTLGTAFRNAQLDRARAIVANGTDEENANVLLVTQELDFGGQVLAVVEDPRHRRPMTLAGASAVFTPRHVIGEALAARASRRINPRISGLEQVGSKLRMLELRVDPTSSLAGRTLEAADLPRRFGVTIIGQWTNGQLQLDPGADTVLEPNGIVITLGGSQCLDRVAGELGSTNQLPVDGLFVVAGYGEVGRRVTKLLRAADEQVVVIDERPAEGVDIVGNVLDPDVLKSAPIEQSQAVLLALDSDMATLFAAVIVRDLHPNLEIIARVNQVENVDRIHHAGVDYVLSISQVAGQILSSHLLDSRALFLGKEFRLSKTAAPSLAGQHPRTSGIRRRAGCSVVAVERQDRLFVDFDDDFRFSASDSIYVCGSHQSVEAFETIFSAPN